MGRYYSIPTQSGTCFLLGEDIRYDDRIYYRNLSLNGTVVNYEYTDLQVLNKNHFSAPSKDSYFQIKEYVTKELHNFLIKRFYYFLYHLKSRNSNEVGEVIVMRNIMANGQISPKSRPCVQISDVVNDMALFVPISKQNVPGIPIPTEEEERKNFFDVDDGVLEGTVKAHFVWGRKPPKSTSASTCTLSAEALDQIVDFLCVESYGFPYP